MGGGDKGDSILLLKKNFCNIYLVLEMKRGKNERFLIHFQFGKTLDLYKFPFPQKYLCSFEGKWRMKRDKKGSGGLGERKK